MKKLWVALLLISVSEAYCQEEILLTRQAQAYYEAKEYDKAIELYEKLEQEKLLPWQISTVKYNIATILLEDGDWEEALTKFQEIQSRSPLLQRRIKTNIAYAYFQQGNQLATSKKMTDEDYRKAIFLFRDAIRVAKEAEGADCKLQAFEGQEDCTPSGDLTQLKSSAKRALSQMLDQYLEYRIHRVPIKQGVPVLLSGVNIILSDIKFLESKKLNDKLKNRYLELIVREIEWWLPLWESQKKKMPELEKAEQNFNEGLQLMERENLAASREAFQSSATALSSLMQQIWGEDPLIEVLQNLLVSYYRALSQVPLQESSLYQLQTEQNQLRSITDPTPELNAADKNLSLSINAINIAKLLESRILVEEARQWIRRLMRQMRTEAIDEPKYILENAIEEQQHALDINRLTMQMETPSSDIQGLVKNAQQETVKVAETYLPQVLAKQIREYPIRCQCKPWNHTLPLFEKGNKTANEANDILAAESGLATNEQELTLRYWREALEGISDQKSESRDMKEVEEIISQKQEIENMQEVLRELQQMEQDDRQPRPEQVLQQEGIRPW